jgi:hypothetical protein
MSVATGSYYRSYDKAGAAGLVGEDGEAPQRIEIAIGPPSALTARATQLAAARPGRGGRLARVLAMIFGSSDLLVRMAAVRAEEIEAVKRTGG